jgi:hypothetical protein
MQEGKLRDKEKDIKIFISKEIKILRFKEFYI